MLCVMRRETISIYVNLYMCKTLPKELRIIIALEMESKTGGTFIKMLDPSVNNGNKSD